VAKNSVDKSRTSQIFRIEVVFGTVVSADLSVPSKHHDEVHSKTAMYKHSFALVSYDHVEVLFCELKNYNTHLVVRHPLQDYALIFKNHSATYFCWISICYWANVWRVIFSHGLCLPLTWNILVCVDPSINRMCWNSISSFW